SYVEIDHNNIKGCGMDWDITKALLKARSEFYERKVIRKVDQVLNLSSSSGFACHVCAEDALYSATCELIERDATILCWHMKRPAKWLRFESLAQLGLGYIVDQIKALKKFDIDLCIGILSISGDYITVTGYIRSTRQEFGFAIDSSCSKLLVEAVISVYFTLMTLVSILQTRKKNGESIHRAITLDNVYSTSDLIEYYLSPDRSIEQKWFFEDGEISEIPLINHSEQTYTGIIEGLTIPEDLVVARSFSDSCQNYILGEPYILNLDRLLSCFSVSAPKTWCHHPLG
ncbi:MAG: YcaO-like family protein, partial [Bacteriovoracaceae bacterium]|nr:YcaO-like family protein [Bacteriovoracaceae bacterium]